MLDRGALHFTNVGTARVSNLNAYEGITDSIFLRCTYRNINKQTSYTWTPGDDCVPAVLYAYQKDKVLETRVWGKYIGTGCSPPSYHRTGWSRGRQEGQKRHWVHHWNPLQRYSSTAVCIQSCHHPSTSQFSLYPNNCGNQLRIPRFLPPIFSIVTTNEWQVQVPITGHVPPCHGPNLQLRLPRQTRIPFLLCLQELHRQINAKCVPTSLVCTCSSNHGLSLFVWQSLQDWYTNLYLIMSFHQNILGQNVSEPKGDATAPPMANGWNVYDPVKLPFPCCFRDTSLGALGF